MHRKRRCQRRRLRHSKEKSQRRKQERGFWIRSILGEGGLAGAALDIEQYDVVFVGYPIWWYIAPTIINTFLESYDFSGKTIVPFATSGGSGMGKTNENLVDSCPGAVLLPGKMLNGKLSESELKAWVGQF
ncbi:MAG: hypothetical protein HFE72_12005 [Emergencia sp.]|nr:hypothetical protein [Emergencia sp.]